MSDFASAAGAAIAWLAIAFVSSATAPASRSSSNADVVRTARLHSITKAPSLPKQDVDREEQQFAAASGARYMETGTCADTTYEGWTGFPLKLCTYKVRDRLAGEKRATVVLLDAAPRQLARWVVDACLEVLHTSGLACTRRVRRWILEQSGGQFPVAGIVLEDMDGDGLQSMYVFRDGVTCVVDSVQNGSTDAPTAVHIRQAIGGRVRRVGRYARIASTTREDYRGNSGTVDVGTSAAPKPEWRLVARSLYQKAWGSDRNELIVAWLRGHP